MEIPLPSRRMQTWELVGRQMENKWGFGFQHQAENLFFISTSFTIQIVRRVESMQSLLTPLHECVLLALIDPLKQLDQLFFLIHLLAGPTTQRVAA